MSDYSFTKHADRQLQKLPKQAQRRIIKKIKFYLESGDPLQFADSIKGVEGKIYRFRIGDYRVIFDWIDNNGDHIRVLKVASRADVYE